MRSDTQVHRLLGRQIGRVLTDRETVAISGATRGMGWTHGAYCSTYVDNGSQCICDQTQDVDDSGTDQQYDG